MPFQQNEIAQNLSLRALAFLVLNVLLNSETTSLQKFHVLTFQAYCLTRLKRSQNVELISV
jgi:hypothetical protein